MNVTVPFTGERITATLQAESDDILICEVSIRDEFKIIKFERPKNLDFFKSIEQVYVQISTGQNGFGNSVEYNYTNMVRKAKLTIQKVGSEYHLLPFYEVRASVACIVSWVDSTRGNKLKTKEASDCLLPIPIPWTSE